MYVGVDLMDIQIKRLSVIMIVVGIYHITVGLLLLLGCCKYLRDWLA